MPASLLPERTGALVLGANYRGLGVVRSLGRRGIPVWVACSDEHRVACASRYAQRTVGWVTGGELCQVDHLLRLARRYGLDGWTLFPSCDETARMLSRNRELLERRYLLAAPPTRAMEVAYDKRLTHALADQVGVPQPRTHFPASRVELAVIDCDFPVVLKPAVKPDSNVFTAAKAWPAENRDELFARYDEAVALVPADVLMVQELVPGSGGSQLSYAALCLNGEPIASASAVRLRQQPMDFGKASTYVETAADDDVAELARRLLGAAHFSGLVEVEFKRDARDGVPKLLDINARVWGWHTLCARAGVDFPWLEWQLVHGRSPRPVAARPGVRWMRMATDLPTAVREVLSGRMALGDYLRSFLPPLEGAIFAADDPWPALLDLPYLALLAVRRRRRGSATPDAPLPATTPAREPVGAS